MVDVHGSGIQKVSVERFQNAMIYDNHPETITEIERHLRNIGIECEVCESLGAVTEYITHVEDEHSPYPDLLLIDVHFNSHKDFGLLENNFSGEAATKIEQNRAGFQLMREVLYPQGYFQEVPVLFFSEYPETPLDDLEALRNGGHNVGFWNKEDLENRTGEIICELEKKVYNRYVETSDNKPAEMLSNEQLILAYKSIAEYLGLADEEAIDALGVVESDFNQLVRHLERSRDVGDRINILIAIAGHLEMIFEKGQAREYIRSEFVKGRTGNSKMIELITKGTVSELIRARGHLENITGGRY